MKRTFLGILHATVVVSSFAAAGAVNAQAPAPAGNVTVLTIVDVSPDYAMPGNVAKSAVLLAKLAADTQQRPGLVSFKILRDARRDNHFVIEAVWKDMQSFELYSGADTTRAFRTAFQPGAGGPFDERVYVDLGAAGRP
jgi:quinol monooxygenase YgiN